MTSIEKYRLCVEFASPSVVTGWAIDLETKEIIESLSIRADSGVSCLLKPSDIKYREDLNEVFALKYDRKLGFKVNLVDAFNDCVDDYSIFIGEEKVWSFSEYLASVDQQSDVSNGLFPQQVGNTNNIAIIYSKDSWLKKIVSKVYNWSPHYFNKEFHGINNYSFYSIEEFLFQFNSARGVRADLIICEREVYRQLYLEANEISGSADFVFLDEKSINRLDFNGMSSSLLSMSNVKVGNHWAASSFLKFLSPLTFHSPLFFSSSPYFFTIHSSEINNLDKINEHLFHWQGTEEKIDIILYSTFDIDTLESIRDNPVAIFINTHSLKYTADIFSNDKFEFIKACTKRGLKILKVRVEP